MDEISAAFKGLRLDYVPPSNFPYISDDSDDEKFDDVNGIDAESMIELIDEWFKENNLEEIELPRRFDCIFVDSVNRFVYSGKLRSVTKKISDMVRSLLIIIKKLLLEKDCSLCSPRKFFYLLKNDASFEFKDKVTLHNVNECLVDICCLFRCSRKSLKLSYARSSCVFGICLQYQEIDMYGNKRVIDCSGMLHPYTLNLDDIDSVQAPKSCPPNSILIVEKLTVLETLIEEIFCYKHPCVLITGCGQPDVQCRRFAKLVHDALKIPICALVDFNAYGINIIKSYKVGSSNLSYESYKLTVPSLEFVGLSGQDLKDCNIKIVKLTDMSTKELSIAKKLKGQPWLKDTEGVSDSLSWNIEWEKRADIELLEVEKGFCYLTNEYLAKKVKKVLSKRDKVEVKKLIPEEEDAKEECGAHLVVKQEQAEEEIENKGRSLGIEGVGS